MKSKRKIVTFDPNTEKQLDSLSRMFGKNKSATVRYCINYCYIKMKGR